MNIDYLSFTDAFKKKLIPEKGSARDKAEKSSEHNRRSTDVQTEVRRNAENIKTSKEAKIVVIGVGKGAFISSIIVHFCSFGSLQFRKTCGGMKFAICKLIELK